MKPAPGALAGLLGVCCACAAPIQQGEPYVAPGASERFMLAMSMGYLGTFEREMVPGQVRRALLPDQLPKGAAVSAKLGDYVLENGHVLAAITNIDGTERGGRLVDLARKPKSSDGIERLEHEVLGKKVVYDALKIGVEPTTQTAFVEVSGRVDATDVGGPILMVSTRYDAAPGIEAIVVHTHFKVEQGSLSAESSANLLDEKLLVVGSDGPIVDTANGYGATLGKDGAYLYRPLFDGATLTASASAPRVLVGVKDVANDGDGIIVTRSVSPLERPDTAALAVALARTEGRGIGEIEVRVNAAQRGVRLPNHGDLAFVAPDGARYDVCGLDTTGEDSHFPAKLPAGRYKVGFQGIDGSSNSGEVEVITDRIAFITLHVGRQSSKTALVSSCPAKAGVSTAGAPGPSPVTASTAP